MAKKDQKLTSTEAKTVVEPKVDSTSKSKSDRKSKPTGASDFTSTTMVGGLALIVSGLFFLLKSLNFIDFSFWRLLNLWPLLLIIIGLGIIGDINLGWRKIAILLQLAVALLGVVMLINGFGNGSDRNGYRWQTGQSLVESYQTIPLESGVKSAKLDINVAGDLTITSQEKEALLDINGSASDFAVISNLDGVQTVKVDFDNFGSGRNESFLDLNQETPFEIKLDLGAGQLRADLKQVNVTELAIKSGASDIRVDLGHPVDAEALKAKIDVGLSNVEIGLPTGSGVLLRTESGLADVDTTGLTKITDNTYQSVNYADSEMKYEITLKSGLAGFKINYY